MVRLQLGQRSKPSSLGASFSPHPAQCHLSIVSNGDGLGSRSSVKKTSVSRRSNSRLKPMPLFWQTRSPSGARLKAFPQYGQCNIFICSRHSKGSVRFPPHIGRRPESAETSAKLILRTFDDLKLKLGIESPNSGLFLTVRCWRQSRYAESRFPLPAPGPSR